MRRVSLNARTAYDAATTDEVEVALIMIEHPLLDAPVRLSTDPTERLSTDPLMYGTRSTWMESNPAIEPFLFILASTDIPSDLEDAPAAAAIVVENVDSDIAETLRSFTDRPTVHMAVVMASSPDLIEVEFRGMVMVGSSGNAGEITLEVSRAPIEEESVPMDRFTKNRFPGMFR
ncbi:hypothetical protein HKX23_17495 [Sulfitobacter sp. KE29]|uniref:hypothetical protein n=1 Tax=unclassified Sulfitobacter TaxID=196795 RepID=UPI0023E3316C|nr:MULTISPECIES: hypothetical protein [unclassified Sulfitobacter]MDF3420146.1 hypothetical protein [Sulfitobacter sp. Ks38]MDF3427631.1 hypothetical protein [Sulfitobacter sp. KE29]MDF3431210.1 hypothetical protein [Sulfitobacter sp. S46]MDF3445983.1 hypothetical protein [Sulfitobacter sp. KE31]MDF3549992.1 hypothetical protein [Sulfitobacter sp. KE28]